MTKTVALGLALILAAASPAAAKPAAAPAQRCPHLSFLGDAAKLTDFEGSGKAQFQASLGGEASQCVIKAGVIHMRLKFKVTGTLQEGAKTHTRKVPYFVAVMQGSQVKAKQVYAVEIPFAGGARTVSVEERINRVDIPIEKGWMSDDYAVTVGFQLTREQLAYNRANAN
jgi:hypothetical protein